MLRKSVLSNFVSVADLAREEAFAQRAKRNESDPEFLERRDHFRFRLSPPQRIFALQRRDRLNLVGATDRLHAGFRKSEVLHLALLNQILHRSRHVSRSARWDRRGADKTDRCTSVLSRFSDASATSLMCSGRLSSPACLPVFGSILNPNLVAITTSVAERSQALHPRALRW